MIVNGIYAVVLCSAVAPVVKFLLIELADLQRICRNFRKVSGREKTCEQLLQVF